ncbi:MAG TPA: hypothetical protein VK249_13730 [Anaerolineales bacterium]|nr:hypothetical protein [Anaerolineales bacterium]
MRKSTIFISAVLTTFALVMLYGVISAYRDTTTNVAEAAVLPTTTSAPEPTATDAPIQAPTQTAVTPEQAAQLAAQVVSNSNLLSAESSNFNGVNAYLITFANHDIVYVGLDGQILSVQVAPVVVNVAAPVQSKKNKGNGGGGGSTQSNHESHEEHDD